MKRTSITYPLLIICLTLCWFCPMWHSQAQFIEGMTQRPFNKNRVQFKDFEWRFKTSPNLEFYYYEYGSRLSDFAILYAEEEFNRIADLIGYSPTQKIRLFIYNSVTDLMQSNVGLNTELLAIGGQVNFIRPIIEVPFTGSLYAFKQEVSKGIAQVLLNEMMYGTGFREMLQSAQIFNLPEWYLSGMSAYAAYGWSQEMDDYMRTAIRSNKIRHPNRSVGDDATLVGQSFWNFIAQKYGEHHIASILNLTRITRNEELAFQNTLGKPFRDLVKEWRNFYTEISDKARKQYEPIKYDKVLNGNRNNKYALWQVKLSPDGRYVAYTLNQRGRYKVVVRDLRRQRKKVIMRGGFQVYTQRFNKQIPLIAWSDNHKLGVAFMKKGKSRIEVFHLDKRRKKKPVYAQTFEFFNQIVGFDISADATHFAISADRRGVANIESGVNDVYIYNTKEQFLKKVTPSDLYDDRDPVFVGTSNDIIIFSSNRPNDTLNLPPATYKDLNDDYNLFLYNPKISEELLTQLTYSNAQETQPECHDLEWVYYLSNENGINNLYKLNLQNGKQEILTNSLHDLRAFSVAQGNLAIRYFGSRKLKERLVLDRNAELSPKAAAPETYRLQLLRSKGYRASTPQKKKDAPPVNHFATDSLQKIAQDTLPAYDPENWSFDNYVFDPQIVKEFKQSNRQNEQNQISRLIKKAQSSKKEVTIKGVFPYEPRFTAEQTVTTPLIDPLRGFGLLFEVRLADMLENHNFHAGILGITDLKSSNYFAEYNYLGKRIDVGARYDRKSIFVSNSDLIHRYSLNKIVGRIALPFTNALRIEGFAGYMNTRFTDIGVLSNPDVRDDYVHLKGQLVFDNTVSSGMNMLQGSRAMVSYEQNLGMGGNIEKSFDKLFVDLRHYQSLDREIVLATRFAYGHFGGKAPKQFMLGGMDNWMGAQTGGGSLSGNPLRVEPGIGNSDLLFHEFATNLRGFDYNAASGRQFFVFNAELRLPLIKYIFRETVKSRFFRNLQFIGFYDAGATWNDRGPWERNNDINTYIIRDGQTFEVIVRNYKNPYLMGFGWGVRTYLLGYYLKVDAAWSVNDFIVSNKPRYYFTLGYDF